MSAGIISETSQDNKDNDAADFLLSNSEYHDWFLTVGNPKIDNVETIGVTSVYLIANSLVFRKMFEDRKEPESQTHITDVSPATFKLMLRFIYGGVNPRITATEAIGLAFFAYKYRIMVHLLQGFLKLLIPKSVEDVFKALICVTYANFPDLEVHVTKIIQEETDKVVESGDFLKINKDCLLYIVKQDTLNIDEVELWRHVVRWAEHRVNPTTTVREQLAEILKHVRLLTFTSEEILEHILPTKILTPEEFMDLTLAVKTKQSLDSSVLCKVQEQRNIYKAENTEFTQTCTFKISDYHRLIKYTHDNCSTLVMKPSKSAELKSFRCRSEMYTEKYSLMCTIKATRATDDDDDDRVEVIRIEVEAGDDEEVILPIKLENGQPLIMNPEETWIFNLEFNNTLPAFKVLNITPDKAESIYCPIVIDEVTYIDYLQVLQIDYKEKP